MAMPAFGAPGQVAQTTVQTPVSSGNLKILPAWGQAAKPPLGKPFSIIGDTVAPKRALDKVADSADERQLTVAAENALIPVVYGRDRIGARVANVLSHGGFWIVQAVWCEGQIDAVESWTMGDKAPETGVTATHYLGLDVQPVDPTLEAAFAATGVTYADTLPGIAYSVFKVPVSKTVSFSFNAIIRGRLVYDYRTGLTAWSDSPALCLADFIVNTKYGMGYAVDAESVIALTNSNDTLIGGEKSRTLNLTISNAQDVFQWADVLRTYAGCWVLQTDNGLKFVPDAVRTPSKHYAHDLGNIKAISPLRKKPVYDSPTVMILRYTNTTAIPWRDDTVTIYAPGVLAGTTPRRESEVPMPGIHSASMASREAIRRLNHLTLSDLEFSVDVYDDGLAVELGDVVEVSHPLGLSAKPMRVVGVAVTEVGRYSLSLVEYDPAAYSGSVITTPTYPDTNLPNPGLPPPPTGLVVTEYVFQQRDGTYTSGIRLGWFAPDFPFTTAYRITIKNGANTVFSGTASYTATTWASPPLVDQLTYQVDISTVSLLGNESSPASVSIYVEGKLLPPGDVPSLTAFEVGGEVRLSWGVAFDIDIWRYEVRYAEVGAPWASGILIDRVDALRLTTKAVPAGTWDLMVKAVDSVGNYSINPVRRTVEVTLDADSFLVDTVEYDTPTLTNMTRYVVGRLDGKVRWVNSSSAAWSSVFGSAMSGYSSPVLSYFAIDGELLTEPHDYGLALSGNWESEASAQVLSGTYSDQMEISDDGSTWDVYPSMSAKRTGRWSRIRINNTGGVIVISSPDLFTRINSTSITENGYATTSSVGATTVYLVGEYALAKSITITPVGSEPRNYVIDNVVVGGATAFDVYIFDGSDTQVANPFFWQFNGV